MVCTFIGHRTVPKHIREKLHATLCEMIEQKGVDVFYVGNQGQFDAMVYHELELLKKMYPHIRYNVVLAYYHTKTRETLPSYDRTIYPQGIEAVPKRFAISWRNQWMIDHSDFLIAYVTGEIGNAAAFWSRANRKALSIINLAD